MKARYENWLYLLLSNGILVYGILELAWPIFPLVYLWWWEGLLNTTVSTFIGKRAGDKVAGWFQLFPYFIYWIFLVILLGVLAANNDQVLINLGVVMFKNIIFNLCLLLLILHLGFRIIRGFPPREEVFLLQIRLHVGIVLGGLAMFASQKFGINNVIPVALTLLGVKGILDFWSIKG